ncbi:MAG: hypothetical protein RL621_1994 [Bacteroidota bacterium]|jgi:hypothetical protein
MLIKFLGVNYFFKMSNLLLFLFIFLSCSGYQSYEKLNVNKIQFDPSRWYQMTHTEIGVEELFDEKLTSTVALGKKSIVQNYEIYYPLLEGESLVIEQIRMYDGQGNNTIPFKAYVIDKNWKRKKIAEFTGEHYNKWVGPNPQSPDNFKLDSIYKDIRYIVLESGDGFPTEIDFYGVYKRVSRSSVVKQQTSGLKHFFGVNAFEWDFVDSKKDPYNLDQKRLDAIQSFGGIRHYLDWERIENKEGDFTFNPSHNGGWNYDAIYAFLKSSNKDVLVCLKTLPKWMLETYPAQQKDNENIPVKSGKDLTQPASYIEQARAAFQIAARYGSNQSVDPSLVKVNTNPRWSNDKVNQKQIGLGLLNYIECDNERDKWWKGRKAYQTGREYAANLSAFYDGHKQTLGKDVGVKNADPNFKVVMAGLANPSVDYIKGMIDWCKEFRGYRKDGSLDLCWDVINFHYYTNETSKGRGVAPELISNGKYADSLARLFVQLSNGLSKPMPVWVTEAGYDLHPSSPNRAIAVQQKTIQHTQADWLLRTSLLYARNGVEKVFFYQLRDDNPESGKIYASSGLLNKDFSKRPIADYVTQTIQLFGDFVFVKTIQANPIVDQYKGPQGKDLYIAYYPDEVGKTGSVDISIPNRKSVTVYVPNLGTKEMKSNKVMISNGKLSISISETPSFIVVDNDSSK